MINKNDFYLKNIELLKKLAPVMERLGIEDDEQWLYIPSREEYILLEHIDNYEASSLVFMEKAIKIKTWRSDSMEAALPKWCYRFNPVYECSTYLHDTIDDICLEKNYPWPHWGEGSKGNFLLDSITSLLWDIHSNRGQPKVEALANLILLLDSEGLLYEEVK